MRRFVIAVVAAMALLGGIATLPAGAATGPPKPPKLLAPDVDGGQPYPLGLGGQYGVIDVRWPTPDPSFQLTGYTVTCTTKYFKTNTGPTDPIVINVALGSLNVVTSSTGNPVVSPSDYTTTPAGFPGMTRVRVHEKPGTPTAADRTYPPRVCAITTINAKGSKGGKAGKIGVAGTPNCGLIPQPDQTPPNFTDPKKPTVFAGVEVTSLSNVLFCSSDAVTAKAAWSADQSVYFTGKSKFKRDKKNPLMTSLTDPSKQVACAKVSLVNCNSFATVKKLGLVSGVNTALTLLISGTEIKWEYDATKAHATSCVPSKGLPTDSCAITEAGGVGTITLTSTQSLTIKPGKPIKSPTIDLTFDTTGRPAGDYSIWFKSAKTTIAIGPNTVDILLKSLPQVIADQVGFLASPYNGAAPNPGLYLTDLNYSADHSDPSSAIAKFTVTV